MQDNSIVKYKFSRVPEITTATFQTHSDSSDPDIIKSRDQLEEELKMWYMMFIDKIRGGGHISVAELRRRAGLDVELTDYLFGFDEDCLAYTGTHGLELIKFHPIHLKQIVKPNYIIIDLDDLTGINANNEDLLEYLEYIDSALANLVQESRLEYFVKEGTDANK